MFPRGAQEGQGAAGDAVIHPSAAALADEDAGGAEDLKLGGEGALRNADDAVQFADAAGSVREVAHDGPAGGIGQGLENFGSGGHGRNISGFSDMSNLVHLCWCRAVVLSCDWGRGGGRWAMEQMRSWIRRGWAALGGWAGQCREPLFIGALWAVGGIAAADRWAVPWAWLGVVMVGLAGWVVWRRGWWAGCGLMGIFGLLHCWNLADPLRLEVNRVMAPGAAVQAEVRGVVEDAPVAGMSEGNWQFPLRVEELHSGVASWPAGSGLLYVRLTDAASAPVYGDRVVMKGLLRRPPEVRNPGEFDFAGFVMRSGYAAEFAAEGAAGRWRVERSGLGNPVMAAALRSRDWIAGTVTLDLENSPDVAATVRTMVLGTREKTPDEIMDAFRASGTMHIFSVSGLHVALFAGLLWFVLSRTPLPRGWIIAVSLAGMFFYVFVTGLRPSAWRAALMVGMVMVAPLWNREGNMFNNLGAAAMLLLGWQTQQLFQAGFTLSFGVLLALALLQKPLESVVGFCFGSWTAPDDFLPEELWSRRQAVWYWIRRKLVTALAVSTASTLGSMPLMIGYFNLVTPAGVLANLILVTLSLWILVVACAALVSAALGLKPLVLLWNNANWALAWSTIGTAKFFAAMPWGHVRLDPARLWRGDPCEVTVLALEQGGGATRIDTPTGRQWMVDCGGLKHWNRTVRPHLERAPVNRLEGVFLTHPDSYHAGALPQLMRLFQPREMWRVGAKKRKRSKAAGAGGAEAAGAEAADGKILEAGRRFVLDEGVTLEVLFPPAGWEAGVTDDQACVLRLECRGFRILFMGDAGFLTEKSLLSSGVDLRSDVLVMGRHGSDFCGLPEFVRAVRPGAVIFSNNRFPESERAVESWRQRIAGQGVKMFDQALTGGVTLRVDREGLTVLGFVNGERWSRGPAAVSPWSAEPEKPGPLIR